LKKFRQTADTRVSNWKQISQSGILEFLMPEELQFSISSDVFCLVWLYYIVFCITQYYYDILSLSHTHTHHTHTHTHTCSSVPTNIHTVCDFIFFVYRTSEPVSVTQSDMESLVDSAPTSLSSTRNGFGDDAHFGIRRFMEDLGIFSLFHSNIQSKVENTCYINSIKSA